MKMLYLIRQNVLYEAPDSSSRRLQYLTTGEMVIDLHVDGDGYRLVESSLGKIGWVRTDLLDDYVDPFENDYQYWIPNDQEIDVAVAEGRAAQFIQLNRLGYKMIHRNLCGPFCVAMLRRINVLPALRIWKEEDKRAEAILKGNKGTSVSDLTKMIGILGLMYEDVVRFDAHNPPSARKLQDPIDFSILGVGINGAGKIVRGGWTRHWVVLMDTMLMGNSGVLRVYNPYHNRVEIVFYDEVLEAGGWLTAITGISF